MEKVQLMIKCFKNSLKCFKWKDFLQNNVPVLSKPVEVDSNQIKTCQQLLLYVVIW